MLFVVATLGKVGIKVFNFSTTTTISIIRFAIKIFGLYYLIYLNYPAIQIIIYTALVGFAEGYEILATYVSHRKPEMQSSLYTVVAVLNAALFVGVLLITRLYVSEFALLGFVIILSSSIPGGFWAGLFAGTSMGLFYFLTGLYLHAPPILFQKIPFFIVIGLLSGIVTEQRLSAIRDRDEAIEKSTRQKEVNRLKNEFIAIASHNLRTPLTTLKGYLDVFISGNGDAMGKEQRTSMYENMQINLQRLHHLIEDLLNVVTLENEEYHLVTVQTDIFDVIKRVIEEMRLPAKQKKVTLEVIKSEKPLPLISIDPKRISEALSNLVDNAIKFSKEGGNVTITAKQEGSQVVVMVKDRGVGIEEEVQKTLFQKFHRGTDVLTYDYEGVGLGLYIAKLIVEAHGGKISFESVREKGSTFYFSIPLATVEKLLENL